MSDSDYKYIDCLCSSMDHVMRICYDEDHSEFHIEYRPNRFPGPFPPDEFELSNPNRTILKLIRRQFKRLHLYFLNIKYAIFGQPNWYTVETLLGPNQAYFLKKFLEENLRN